MIRTATCTAILCLAFSCAEVKKAHQLRPLPSAIPHLNIVSDTTAAALKISMLDIKTVVAANIATTTFEIKFYNPNDKILEGEFEFPLADGQNITRYALDIDGSLREAVVVEKAKARIAFEATVRQKIDPGLVEKTKGNNFRTRIYPIPAKGYRRVLIAVEQTLEQESGDLLYQLPLYAKDPIDSFSINLSVIKSNSEPQLDENGIPGLRFNKQKQAYTAEHSQTGFIADKTVAFVLPGSEKKSDIVLTESHDGQTYFYVNSRVEPQHKNKRKPSTIGVLWDVSGSGAKRNLQKEMDLLIQYLARVGSATVSLVPFNISTQTKEDFGTGNTGKLIERIKALDYDGGTQLGAIDLGKYVFDEILLFSDGLSTFGKQDMIFSKSPVMAITSSPSANYSYLKYIAEQTHGKFIDIGKLELPSALNELDGQSLQVINVSYNKSEIEELVTQTTPILNSGFSFSGKLKAASAAIKMEIGHGNEVSITKEFTITKNEESDYDQVKRIWATMRIARLDMEYEKNKEDITRLGKQFSIVTQNTSLIVLDRVEDYVQHEIVPPKELQKQYYALLKDKHDSETEKKENALHVAVAAMNELKSWWNTKYAVKIQKPAAINDEIIDSSSVTIMADGTVQEPAAQMGVDSLTVTAGLGAYSRSYNFTAPLSISDSFSGSAAGFYATSNAMHFTVTERDGDMIADRFDNKRKEEEGTLESTIELKKWHSGAAYLKLLEDASAGERKSKYLTLKKQYNTQPSFFVDAARFFLEKNEKQFGLQVLSNVSEMKLEETELLRIVANQLLEIGEMDLALISFREILKMREEDPQSYRDLALAYNEAKEYDKAVELLYKLVLGEWDSRFGDVKAIALNEMNAIISAHSGTVNNSNIDKRLIYAMPVDVRIVIGWNTDNSDIDLWVTDPRKEKCFYSHNATEIGGRISRDVTQGYGPEEFLLKKAWKGNYSVDVNLFGDHRQNLGGPIAIKADLYTDYGRPTQKRKTINLRVTTDKEVINLGSLKFGS
jgi:tetratricopeptide (TPR) repeat protein